MTNAVELLRTIGERLQTSASVKNVFGDPISAEGKTVVPVARIKYGFGAGAGGMKASGRGGENNPEPSGAGGGGGGGGIYAEPAGVLEITAEGARFIHFFDAKRTALALAGGFLLGVLFRVGRRRR